MTLLPENILRCMSRKDRAPLGKVGVTSAEAQAKFEAITERELQNQIENWFRIQNIPAFRQRMDRKSNMPIGTPDFLVCYKGWFLALEVKVGKNVPTSEQFACLDYIRVAGGLAMVAYRLSDVKRLIDLVEVMAK